MRFNPHTLSAKDLRTMFARKCKHGHLYSEHPNCYFKEMGRTQKVGFIDIETSNLDANYGIILTYCILDDETDEIIKRCIDVTDLANGKFDKNLNKQLIQDMLQFDLLIGYFSTRFDIPFIRSRCLKWHLEFPIFKSIEHKDLYYMVKRLLKLNSNRLEVATKFLSIRGKNHVLGDAWMKAVMCTGDIQKEALAYILDHNVRDVHITKKLYHRLQNYDRGITKSI